MAFAVLCGGRGGLVGCGRGAHASLTKLASTKGKVKGSYIFRLDEFAILLRSPADMAAAAVVANRLLGLLSEPVRIGDEEVFPSASIGIAVPDAGEGHHRPHLCNASPPVR